MKVKKSGKRGEGYIEITKADYEADLAAGLDPETILKPGRHKYVRGGFLKRHGVTPEEVRKAPVKVRISIMLDQDVLEYFRNLAARPNAAPYQTQINQALREVMGGKEREKVTSASYAELIDDPQFIKAVADRVAQARKKRTHKAA